MKIAALLFIASSLILPGSLCAQERRARASNFEADTKWPGILFSISGLERIQDNRLLVSVRVVATAKAARSGTFLGTMSGQRDSSGSPTYLRPFSLDSAVMTDDQTQQKYPALPPVAPPGKAYFPGELVNNLFPGQGETLTVQFAAPPWEPGSGEGRSAKQTVTFLLPGASRPIANVPVPSS